MRTWWIETIVQNGKVFDHPCSIIDPVGMERIVRVVEAKPIEEQNIELKRLLLACYLNLDDLKEELKKETEAEKWWYWTAADGPWSYFRDDYKFLISKLKTELGIK